MNQLPTYEQTIAQKREEIEIPDMADAIWGRVEAALDVEMPVNDTPFFKQPAVWIIGAGILAIIIALFILSKNNTTPAQQNLPQRTEPAIQPDTTTTRHFKPPDPPTPAPKKNTKPVNEKRVTDTAAHRAFTIVEDSALKKPPAVKLPPAGITMPSIEVKQRPKYGVEIPDSEYLFRVKPKGEQ
jgi:hypothetical protein